ncbi:hypothetical protein LC55x_1966 [Lysobacter capsici]|nr:hypothetical protein LC55x_1966 [Lysobacter capsici]
MIADRCRIRPIRFTGLSSTDFGFIRFNRFSDTAQQRRSTSPTSFFVCRSSCIVSKRPRFARRLPSPRDAARTPKPSLRRKPQ